MVLGIRAEPFLLSCKEKELRDNLNYPKLCVRNHLDNEPQLVSDCCKLRMIEESYYKIMRMSLHSYVFLLGRLLSVFQLLVFLNSCKESYPIETGVIDRVSLTWDQSQTHNLLFKYSYLSGTPENAFSETRYYQLNVRQPEAPILTEIDQNTLRAKTPPFNLLGRDLLVKNLKKLRPLPDEKITLIKEGTNVVASSLHPSQQWLLAAHKQKPSAPEMPETIYSLYHLEDHSYRNVKGPTSVPRSSPPQPSALLSWTGFGNDVMVEYKEKNQVYYARSQLDLSTAKLKPLTVFKSYVQSGSEANRWEASFTPLSRQFKPMQDSEADIKVLGWESVDKVLFLERRANDKAIYLSQYDFQTQRETQMAKMAQEKSYYDYLDTREQISFPQNKVVYLIRKGKEGTDELWLSNFEGTEQKMILNRIQDLPVGLSEFVRITKIVQPEIVP